MTIPRYCPECEAPMRPLPVTGCDVCDWEPWGNESPWPAPNPDLVQVEEEFDHYVAYVVEDGGYVSSWTCHTLEEALAVRYHEASKVNYPLKSSWVKAVGALNALAAFASDVDQDWSRWPASEVDRLAKTLRQMHSTWIDRAEEDGRTW